MSKLLAALPETGIYRSPNLGAATTKVVVIGDLIVRTNRSETIIETGRDCRPRSERVTSKCNCILRGSSHHCQIGRINARPYA